MSGYGAHRETVTHWCPKPVEESPYTACGRNIDGACDAHEAAQQPCNFGIAWTRSPLLESMQERPYDKWPPPCPACLEDAQVEAARLGWTAAR